MPIKTPATRVALRRALLLCSGNNATVGVPITVEVQLLSTAALSLYVGGADVRTLTGVQVTAGGAPFIIDLAPGDDLWGIAGRLVTPRVLLTRQ